MKYSPLPFIFLLFFYSCTRDQITSREEAMRPTSVSQISDDLELAPLLQGIQDQVKRFETSGHPLDAEITFGKFKIKRSDYIAHLKDLVRYKTAGASRSEWLDYLMKNFELHEVYGEKKWSDVFITSYYEPIIPGASQKSSRFSEPLYSLPKDLIFVDLKSYQEIRPSLFEKGPNRLIGRLEDNRVVPYFSRAEIHHKKALRRKSRPLAWVDPIDAFFLQIQGSGQVRYKNGKSIRVGYAGQNGHEYIPIGKFMTHEIPLEEMSLQRIEAYLRALSKKEAQEYLDRNPSYVFFRTLEDRPITSFGTEVIDGRTIATDARFFPKGTIAYMEFEKPLIHPDGTVEWVKTSRIVIDQDTGGAIKGPGRVDLFWGSGDTAKKHAGIFKRRGRLYYFVPKSERN